jgi:hypothetical protein
VATELLRREFTVDAPIDEAWRQFADVATWPTWAPHIRRVDVTPAGRIGPTSAGTLFFRPIGRSRFAVSSCVDGSAWEWTGRVLGLVIRYDHRFAATVEGTRLTWTVAEDGTRRSLRGRLFASIYGRLVDRAIPRLQAEMKSTDRGA